MQAYRVLLVFLVTGLIGGSACASDVSDREATIQGVVRLPAEELRPHTTVEVSCPEALLDVVVPTDSVGLFGLNFTVSGSVARKSDIACHFAAPSVQAARAAADAQVLLWDPTGPHGSMFVTLLPVP